MIVNPIVVDMDVGTPTKVPVSIQSTQTTVGMGYSDAINVIIRPINLQEKTVTPTQNTQEVTFDVGEYQGLSKVTVNPIPSNYGLVTWNGSVLTVQ